MNARKRAQIRVRPFHALIASPSPSSVVELSGAVEEVLVLTAFGRRMPASTVSTGADERGRFAILIEGVYQLAEGAVLRIEPEFEEGAEPGGCLTVEFGEAPSEDVRRQLRARGFDPASARVFGPNSRRHFCVYFDSDGAMNGSGSSGVDSVTSSPRN